MQDLTTGTVVTALGLPESWGEEAEYAIASHFFSALAHDRLVVNIHQGKSDVKALGEDELDRLLRARKDRSRLRKNADDILSGQQTWQSWQAVCDSKTHILRLSNKDKVTVYLKTNQISHSSVALIRRDMLIARHDSMLSNKFDELRKSPDYLPFALVIDVDQDSAPELFKLVKGAEGPYHNTLARGRLSKKEEKRLKELFADLSEQVEKHLPKNDRESFDLPLFPTPRNAKEKSAGNSQKLDGGETAKPRPAKTPESPPGPSSQLPGQRPAPNIPDRLLSAGVASRYGETNEEYRVKLRISPEDTVSEDETLLAVCLDEDSDRSRARTWLEFMDISIDGESLPLEGNTLQVSLGRLVGPGAYDLDITLKKPRDKIGGAKVALQPILNLKRLKKKAEGSA